MVGTAGYMEQQTGTVIQADRAALLLPNTPNPFTADTRLRYMLYTDQAKVMVSIHDMTGRPVRVLEQGARAAGFYTIRWGFIERL